MIVEGAFYKLPELLLGQDVPAEQYEATMASHLAMAVLLELNARNVPLPQRRIHVERPYPLDKAGPACRGDLYVNLAGVFPASGGLTHYGIAADNWIEAKFHARIGRASGTVTKVSNVGRLARDLLRLCLFVPEAGEHRSGRYLLAVFNRPPHEYLAFGRQDRSLAGRDWLRETLSPGRHQVEISFQDETPRLVGKVGAGLASQAGSLHWSLDVVTHTFEPDAAPAGVPLYWGYLVRIAGFAVQLGAEELICRGDAPWTEAQTAIQQRLAGRVLGLAEEHQARW